MLCFNSSHFGMNIHSIYDGEKESDLLKLLGEVDKMILRGSKTLIPLLFKIII